MPVAVKERFAGRPAFATGIYVLGFNIGSALASALAVPIADAAGSWRWSLIVFSAVTLVLVLAWSGSPERRRLIAVRTSNTSASPSRAARRGRSSASSARWRASSTG